MDLARAPNRVAIAPKVMIALSLAGWLSAVLAGGLLLLWQIVGWLTPDEARRSLLAFFLVAGVGAASLFQIGAVLRLSLRMWCFGQSCRRQGLLIRLPEPWRNLPTQVLWPMLIAPLAIPLQWTDHPWPALWLTCVSFALLAAEVQRGYITVADRRLRLALARAIGHRMRCGER
ncbi:MAG: hypothetical protein RMJ35_12610 [Phycisphaerales bacterium]|nr:hypothetical protein [Phycisphaerales bacterium]